MVETFLNLVPHHPSILRVEMTKEASKIKLPPFVEILREVTNEDKYETWYMARGDYKMPDEDVEAISNRLVDNRCKEINLLNKNSGSSSSPGLHSPNTGSERDNSPEKAQLGVSPDQLK